MNFLKKLSVVLTLSYGHLIRWYTKIDKNCFLGAMPLQCNYKKLIKKEKIKAVLSLSVDYELDFTISKEKWHNQNVNYKHLPVSDYKGAASLEEIIECVDYIKYYTDRNENVFIYCKAGTFRSALIAACYLIKTYNLKPNQAYDYIKKRRFNVLFFKKQYKAMENYYFLNILNGDFYLH